MKQKLFPLLIITLYFVTVNEIYSQKEEKNIAWYNYSKQTLLLDTPQNVSKGLLIQIDTSQIHSFENFQSKSQKGYKGKLINFEDVIDTIFTQDQSLIMILQAINSKNIWVSTEYWLMSDCGNSYMNHLELKSNYYVEFNVPKHYGKLNTKFRLKLLTKNGFLYSNEFYGSINPTILNQNPTLESYLKNDLYLKDFQFLKNKNVTNYLELVWRQYFVFTLI